MSDAPEPAPSLPEPEAQGPSWQESAQEFIAARMELFSLEAKEAGEAAARKGLLVGIIAGCAVFAWLTLLAGLIGWIGASQSAVAWYVVAIVVAVLHLIGAGVALKLLKQPGGESFPLLKAELSKDKAWLNQLKERPKH